MKFDNREDILQITPLWKGERFPDGRPKVPDDILQRMRNITLEEAWGPLWSEGYKFQFEGDLKCTHEKAKLVGRAVTSVMVPMRPDLNQALLEYGQKEEGRKGFFNQWVIDSLTEGDVCVVDMYDKIYKGTFLGGNLTTAIAGKTKTGGGVIWGGIRDVEQMKQIQEVQVYYRGIDPTPIREFVMAGFNTPTKIGNAVCLPGDIVFGTDAGVLFIPAHLVEEVVDGAVKTKVKDMFGFEMITQNKFTTAQIDKNVWTKEMLDLLVDYINTNEAAAKYRDIDWSKEYGLAANGDPTDTQSAL